MSRERGFSNVATVVLAMLLALLVAPLLMTWVVVDVHTKGADRVDLTVPVPLALARLALAFAPADEIRRPVPAELSRHRASVMAVLSELENCPDTELVSVEAPDAVVHIAKRGDRLALDVKAPDATVRCTLPLKAARQVLERWDWQRIEPRLALDFLAAAGHGELVAVDADDARVSVRLW